MNQTVNGIEAYAACPAPGSPDGRYVPKSDVERDILAVLRAECAAFYRSDFEELARHWVHGPEVRRVISGAHTGSRINCGWDELSARLREGMRRYPQDFEAREWLRWENMQIEAGADMAWVTYDQVLVRTNDDFLSAPLQHESKVLRLVDGVWKLVGLFGAVPGVGRDDSPRIELGRDGKVFRINDLARDRLADHPGLVVSAGRLRARNRRYDATLQDEIRRVLDFLTTNLVPRVLRTTGLVPLGEGQSGHPIYCWVRPEQERVLVSFDDAHMLALRLDVSADVYALSPAQQRLARLLAEGRDIADAADQLGVSVNTLRTHLRRMFEKTGTHTQTALISALLSVQRPA